MEGALVLLLESAGVDGDSWGVDGGGGGLIGDGGNGGVGRARWWVVETCQTNKEVGRKRVTVATFAFRRQGTRFSLLSALDFTGCWDNVVNSFRATARPRARAKGARLRILVDLDVG